MVGGVGGRFLGRIEGRGWLLRKNRTENGRRADPSGSNPHSYGESFSESGFIWAIQKFNAVRAALRTDVLLGVKISPLLAGLVDDLMLSLCLFLFSEVAYYLFIFSGKGFRRFSSRDRKSVV